MREFSPLALILGVVIGVVFGAANAYVGLQVGMTVSASIPAAVISMGVLRGLLKRGTLLENNMVQTVGSSGESLAAGFIFTLPALFIMGMPPDYLQMVIWGSVGGLMGVFFMIPLRRALIVKERDTLPYPEGVACAEVLESGQKGGAGARTVFMGLGVGALFEIVRTLGGFGKRALVNVTPLKTWATLDASPALLGVGYILGIRVAGYMLGGAVLGWFVLIPAISFFGADAAGPVAPATQLIADMNPEDIWEHYIRYIGAGAVILGGLFSLFKSAPTIASSVWHGLGALLGRGGKPDRTDRDLPFPLLILGLVGLWALMWYIPDVNVSRAGAVAVLVFGFFFVTVSSRLVGLVGNSSNPISGMTIATLLGVTLLFTHYLGLSGEAAKFSAISVGALVCMALSIAGDCSQDLKTGYLVGATPWKQQVGEMIGVLVSAATLAGVLLLFNESYGFVRDADHPNGFLAPQANIMKVLVEGVMDGGLPWVLILTGMGAALVVELLGLPALPFAVGLYLPLELSATIMAGGVIRWVVQKVRRRRDEGEDSGILGASGLVAGHGLVGVAAAGATYGMAKFWGNPMFANPLAESAKATTVVPEHLVPWLMGRGTLPLRYNLSQFWYDLLPLAPFGLLALWLFVTALKRPRGPAGPAVALEPDPKPPPGKLTPPLPEWAQPASNVPHPTEPMRPRDVDDVDSGGTSVQPAEPDVDETQESPGQGEPSPDVAADESDPGSDGHDRWPPPSSYGRNDPD